MDMIELAREVGKAIQQDEDYIKMRLAEQRSESDEELQELIADYNVKIMAVNSENAKTEKNEERIRELNKEVRGIYSKIMQNENMKEYEASKRDFQDKLQKVMAIITNSADGEDPETTDYIGGMGCTGSCGTCGGCY